MHFNWNYRCTSIGILEPFPSRLAGKSPFQRATEEAVISAVTCGTADLSGNDFSNLSPESQDFVSTCLAKNPRRRPTALQCQRHRWLSSGSRRSSLNQSSPLGRRGSFGSSPTSKRRLSSGSDKSKSKSSPARKPL